MIIQHEGRIYLECEDLIDGLIDNVGNASMELEVYGDEYSDSEFAAIQENIRGYSAAIKVIIDTYRQRTPIPERAEFMQALSNQIDNIISAPLLTRG